MKLFAVLSLMGLASAAAAILGIDYGTEFVKSSLVAPNAPFEILLTPDSQRKDASGLVIKPSDGERIYGSSGVGMTSRFPANSFYAIKPLLGVPFDDLRVGLFQETHPGLELVRTDRNTVAFNASGIVVPIEEVVAMQIKDVKDRATALVRDKTHSKSTVLRQVVVSVPGNFGSAQRQALVDSVELADADLVGLVSDGVAVAINYANSPAMSSKISADKHYIVVYDSGAAATSSTLVSLRLRPDDESIVDVQVEGFGSSVELSGRSLTTLLREMLYERFVKSYKTVDRTPRLLNSLWREAERAKQILSANNEVSVFIESLFDGEDLSTKITRDEFEAAAGDLLDEVTRPLKDSLADFKGEVDAVVLAGGATRTPFIINRLKEEVGESKLSRNVNADEANVQGTCMRGVNLSGLYRSKRKFEVADVVAHQYDAHIRTKENAPPVVQELFARGSTLGQRMRLELPKDVAQIEVYEGRKKLVSWDLPYVKKSLDSLYEPGPFKCIDKASLFAEFTLDSNGILRLNSVDAVCQSVLVPSTTSTTDSVTSISYDASDAETASTDSPEPSTSSTENKEDVSSTVTTTAADSVSSEATTTGVSNETEATTTTKPATPSVRPKSRRVSTKVSWSQAPLGSTERSLLKSHLDKMDKCDEDRKQYSVLHHELESLAYRIRGLVSEGRSDLEAAAHRFLSWVENGEGSLEDLKSHLKEARRIISPEPESTSSEQSTSTKEFGAFTEDAKDSDATASATSSSVVHDEL